MKRMILCFLLSLALAAVSFAQEPADSLQRVSREAPAEAQAPGEQTAEQLWNKANTAYINGLSCTFTKGKIGGFTIGSDNITVGSVGTAGAIPLQIRSASAGSGYWYTGGELHETLL